MRFESNRAWQDAIASVSANRDVLYPVAGVFFLLPTLVQAFFFADAQAQIMASLGDADAMQAAMTEGTTWFFVFSLLAGIVQLVGYLALLALLTDRRRPTVAQALVTGIKSLPTLIAAALIFFSGYTFVGLLIGVLARGLASATGSAALGGILVIALLVGMIYVMVKLSLTLPVVIMERVLNPLSALLRSWHLTKGNSVRLAFFYLLLFIAYLALAVVFSMIVMGLMALFGGGNLALIGGALVSGIVGAVASVLFAAILASIHRQLAGLSPEAESATFE